MKSIYVSILVLFLAIAGSCANITVTYLDYDQDSQWTQEAKDAFEAAVVIWEQTVFSPMEIRINAYYLSFETKMAFELKDEISFWVNTDFIMNFGSPSPEYFVQHKYPPSLAEKLHGSFLSWNNGSSHFSVYMDNETPWDFDEAYNPSQYHHDFISRVLREIAHGLGFQTSAYFSPQLGQPSHQLIPYILDRYTVTSTGTPLNSISQSFSGPILTGNDMYCNGTQAVSANSGAWPRLFAPSIWKRHSISTWDSNQFSSTDPDALLDGKRPPFSAQSFHRQIGGVTKGLMADIGWDLEPINGIQDWVHSQEFLLFPNPSNNGVFHLSCANEGSFAIYDISGKLLHQENFPANAITIIDLFEYVNGIYLIHVNTGYKTFHQRLIKSAQ